MKRAMIALMIGVPLIGCVSPRTQRPPPLTPEEAKIYRELFGEEPYKENITIQLGPFGIPTNEMPYGAQVEVIESR